MFQFLFGKKREEAARNAQLAQFNAILAMANEIANREPRALPTLVKLLARSVQADCMLKVVRTGHTIPAGGDFLVNNLWFPEDLWLDNKGTTLGTIGKSVETGRPLSLGTDVLLVYPAGHRKLIEAICRYNRQTLAGEWKKSELNHDINFWLPWGIGWVVRGHHSLTTGILDWEKQIKDYKAFDCSRIFEFVDCDGLSFKRTSDGTELAEVTNVEFAAIFEIGRLMVEHRVSAYGMPIANTVSAQPAL
jgi:hypothetical protein